MSSTIETTRTYLSAEQKLTAVREHLLEQRPISDICAKYGCSPSNYYTWQSKVLNETTDILEIKRRAKSVESEQLREAMNKIQTLEQKLAQRDGAIAELVQDNIRLKKNLTGET
jgi:transposase